jgi:hypothetical protein
MLRELSLGLTARAPHWAFALSMSTAQHAFLMVALVDAHEAAVLHVYPFPPQMAILQHKSMLDLELPA